MTDSLSVLIYKFAVDAPAARTVGFNVTVTDNGEMVMIVATGGTELSTGIET